MLPCFSQLQAWIRDNFPSLAVSTHTDALSIPYVKVASSFPHPVLVTTTSVHLNIYMVDQSITSKLVAYSAVLLREVTSVLQEEMDGKGKVKELLGLISSHQTSVCVGIAEEIVSAKAVADYLGISLVVRVP